jgi:hypothetical protein
MKIFGKEFITKKELRVKVNILENEINEIKNVFPFNIGQTVYDIQLRDENGRYTKENISLEHSLINEVVVNEKNYFGLVERYRNKDVFSDKNAADAFLIDHCVNITEE